MTGIRRKQPRLRLDPASYRDLCRKVLARDGWRCQFCSRMTQLKVHHQQSRSRSGDDVEENLITLCSECHSSLHRKNPDMMQKNEGKRLNRLLPRDRSAEYPGLAKQPPQKRVRLPHQRCEVLHTGFHLRSFEPASAFLRCSFRLRNSTNCSPKASLALWFGIVSLAQPDHHGDGASLGGLELQFAQVHVALCPAFFQNSRKTALKQIGRATHGQPDFVLAAGVTG